MSAAVWVTVAGLIITTAAIKAIGPLLFGDRQLPGPLARTIPRLPSGLLAALVLTETVGGPHRSVVVDARSGGLAVAAIALALRVPLIGVVVLAAGATALLRAIG
ncbi:MAG: AzlD domain-containing protein [Actinomycetota bacterium]|nr:AzlD domain-containing protein [Actinomycetota bacterium]